MEQKLTPERALDNLNKAAQAYRGTAQEHAVLQESVKVLSEIMTKEDKKEDDGNNN